MFSNLVTISALCMVLAFSGWSRDDPLPDTEIPLPDLELPKSFGNSTWVSYLGSWFDTFVGGSCNCGLGEVKFPTEGATEPAFGGSLTWILSNTKPPDQSKGALPSDEVKQNSFETNTDPQIHNPKNRMTGSGDKYKMAAMETRNSDIVIFLASLFQICWILRMVVWKGMCSRKSKHSTSQTRLSDNSIQCKRKTYDYDLDMDEMRKTLKLLTEYQHNQDRILQQKDDEIEHLARTIEYINRKSTEQQNLLRQRIVVVEAIARRILSLQRYEKDNKFQQLHRLLNYYPDHRPARGLMMRANRRCNNNSLDDGGGDMDLIRVDGELEWDF